MNPLTALAFIEAAHGLSVTGQTSLCFLPNATRPGGLGHFQTGRSWSIRAEDSDESLTEQDFKQIKEYIDDLKAGVYGEEAKNELESLKLEQPEGLGPDDLRQMLAFRDEKLEKQMREVFDISNVPTEPQKKLDWDDLEKKIETQGKKEGVNVEEMRSLVHSIYRNQGLLNEPFKALEVDGLKLNWRQSLETVELWFVVDRETKKGDYEVTFLPATLTIKRRGEVVLEKNLTGKVDCDGCFWTMYKNPDTGSKYLNINLTKRAPKFNNMWDQLFTQSQN